jgi:hypothetical protein
VKMWETRALALLISIGAVLGALVGYWTSAGIGDER